MELVLLLLLFVALPVASMLGLTADSRDSADWRQSNGGWRAPGY